MFDWFDDGLGSIVWLGSLAVVALILLDMAHSIIF